ncbi:MAG TPA: DUF484 family protein [Pseudomonadales bacterium]|nr:DUF484 family protein [Pseudomonadales bacterium]HMY97824.1 DUF484 family protein [Pseudomonadales bacterium]HND27219.1 DUF484 family protein [Pseudomonadales bacterium]HNJ73746.1 DUF484 family protein [Pseudomonadales bacterium]HNN35554.1 DUF484 family protein [Pseudomonadales bacterium]
MTISGQAGGNSHGETSAPSEAEVAAYLHLHRDFFGRHEPLLAEMYFPSPQAGAISLVERQLGILRERLQSTRHELALLMGRAEQNDRLITLTQTLSLQLLDAAHGSEINLLLRRALIGELGNCALSLLVATPGTAAAALGFHTPASAEAERRVEAVLANRCASLGLFRDEELAALFGSEGSGVGSAVLLPIQRGPVQAVLALGHPDRDHYRAGMGTLFISHLGEVIGRVIERLLKSAA